MEQNVNAGADTPTRVLRIALLAAGVWYLLAFVVVAGVRLTWADELEGMEGNAIAQLDDIAARLSTHHYSAVILDRNPIGVFLRQAVARFYEPRACVFKRTSKSFLQVTGMQTRPAVIYLPKRGPGPTRQPPFYVTGPSSASAWWPSRETAHRPRRGAR